MDPESTRPPKSALPPDAPWWAKWLVANAGDWWKWLSTWLIGVAAAAPMLYEVLPELQNQLSPTASRYVQTVLVLLIFAGRVKRQ